MIAHRLSSITDADNILVIDKGKIANKAHMPNCLKNKVSIIICGMNTSNPFAGQ